MTLIHFSVFLSILVMFYYTYYSPVRFFHIRLIQLI